MKPQPKDAELESILADEAAVLEMEAEQEALAVAEKETPLRTNPDISRYVLDVPRDVKGLIELLEEKEKLKWKMNVARTCFLPGHSRDSTSWYSVLGVWVGSIGSLVYAKSNYPGGSLEMKLAILTALVVGGGIGYLIDKKQKKKFQQKIEQKGAAFKSKRETALSQLQDALKPLEQKLLHYEKKCVEEDIVLVHDRELGYSLGHIDYSRGKPILHQKYWKHEGVKQRLIDDSMEIKLHDVKAVLSPHTTLSVDDLKSLPSNTALLCGEKYGFIGGITGEDFRLYLDAGLQYLCNMYTFQQVETGEITTRILVPTITPEYREDVLYRGNARP